MTTTRWLKISALVSLLLGLGHTLGGRKSWSPMGDNTVLETMRSTRFPVMGVERSYLDFYLGFGYSISVLQIMQAILLWQLAALAASNPNAARPMIAVIALATVLCGIISYNFIFPLPVAFSAVLLACLTVSYIRAGKSNAVPVPQT
jgi:hypothetical protein